MSEKKPQQTYKSLKISRDVAIEIDNYVTSLNGILVSDKIAKVNARWKGNANKYALYIVGVWEGINTTYSVLKNAKYSLLKNTKGGSCKIK